MKSRRAASTLGTLLIVAAAYAAGPGSAEPVAAPVPDAPAQCTNHSIGSETYTDCAPSTTAPPGSALRCHNYTVGSDTHTVCAPVATPRLGGPRERTAAPAASAPRCYTYHIGASTYTDCR